MIGVTLMKKKLIIFDLDGTLAPSKSSIPGRIAELLTRILARYQVCVISGLRFETYKEHLLASLDRSKNLTNLHLMPTSGTQYYRFDSDKSDWKLVYADFFKDKEKFKIKQALMSGLEQSGYKSRKTYGELIDDRGSQITLSILGQDIAKKLGMEGVEIKEKWDPDGSKKLKLRDIIAPMIPEFEVRAAGTTSIDVTMPGIDKAYGVGKLLDLLSISKQETLFIGDRLMPGGNDYAVKAMGIDSIQVSGWQDTARIIESILDGSFRLPR
jgi:HAD superfamily hydrolase (TIGR01484 family)